MRWTALSLSASISTCTPLVVGNCSWTKIGATTPNSRLVGLPDNGTLGRFQVSGNRVNQASESRLGLPSLPGCLEFPCDMNPAR